MTRPLVRQLVRQLVRHSLGDGGSLGVGGFRLLSSVSCLLSSVLLLSATLLSCTQTSCDDKGPAAIQTLLPHLTPNVLTNLLHEASVCIADSAAQPVLDTFYNPSSEEAPVARALKVESPTEFRMSTGPLVNVHNRGPSAPYLSIRVPVHFGSGYCLWSVYVCLKPGGSFAQNNPTWTTTEHGTTPAPVVKLSNEILLYAQQRALQ